MLSVSTRIRYGLRALAFMASRDEGVPITVTSIAREEQISQKYLENIFNLLKKGRIVRSRRGPEGGYLLARPPEEISAFDIFDALEGPLDTVECQDIDMCSKAQVCQSRDFWCDFNTHMTEFLRKKSLSDILEYNFVSNEVST